MKYLIVLEAERRVQPFMVTILDIALKKFDKVVLITRALKSSLSTVTLNESIEHLQIPDVSTRVLLLRLFPELFKPLTLKQIYRAVISGRFNWAFIKHLLVYLLDSKNFYNQASEIIQKSEGNQLSILSCWFYSDAFAAAKLKQKYPHITAFSLAHSYEIDPKRTPFYDISFNSYKHGNLDRIFFISKVNKDIYDNATLQKYNKKNTDVLYLGSKKKYHLMNPYTGHSDSFRICSCSTLIDLKNIPLILETLRLWKESPIEWIHFGDGPLFESISALSEEIVRQNPFVSIQLKGLTQNDKIHDYYSMNQVDLFVSVSKSEGIPISIMEAISYGIPVLATNVGGTSEIVKKEFGYLIEPDISANELYNCLRKISKLNNQEIMEMRQNAYSFWNSYFNAEDNLSYMFNLMIDIQKSKVIVKK